MLIVRDVFQAKYGRGDELVALLQEFDRKLGETGSPVTRSRILTDASGPFFTVVTESEVESMGAWEESFRTMIREPWVQEWFGRMVPLVESGSREFYTIVE